jgi:hypothetical protein
MMEEHATKRRSASVVVDVARSAFADVHICTCGVVGRVGDICHTRAERSYYSGADGWRRRCAQPVRPHLDRHLVPIEAGFLVHDDGRMEALRPSARTDRGA